MRDLRRVFRGKRVLVTGHTGFKGSWLSLWLHELGARVSGYSLPPPRGASHFRDLGLDRLIDSRFGDILALGDLRRTFARTRPQIVFHLAAQPLVRASYLSPVETFATNALGTAHVLEAARLAPSVRVIQVVTTDKCYQNLETRRAYRETDRLGGRDPYSASKACAELVAASYAAAFFGPGAHPASVSTVRAGNVIGGGDWAIDRLIPDCARALRAGRTIRVRNPRSTRPWQHVLDPLHGYLLLAARQYDEPARFSGAWNFGPSRRSEISVRTLADSFIRAWGKGTREDAPSTTGTPHEASRLALDSSKARRLLGWVPRLEIEPAIALTASWYRDSCSRDFDHLAEARRLLETYSALASPSFPRTGALR